MTLLTRIFKGGITQEDIDMAQPSSPVASSPGSDSTISDPSMNALAQGDSSPSPGSTASDFSFNFIQKRDFPSYVEAFLKKRLKVFSYLENYFENSKNLINKYNHRRIPSSSHPPHIPTTLPTDVLSLLSENATHDKLSDAVRELTTYIANITGERAPNPNLDHDGDNLLNLSGTPYDMGIPLLQAIGKAEAAVTNAAVVVGKLVAARDAAARLAERADELEREALRAVEGAVEELEREGVLGD